MTEDRIHLRLGARHLYLARGVTLADFGDLWFETRLNSQTTASIYLGTHPPHGISKCSASNSFFTPQPSNTSGADASSEENTGSHEVHASLGVSPKELGLGGSLFLEITSYYSFFRPRQTNGPLTAAERKAITDKHLTSEQQKQLSQISSRLASSLSLFIHWQLTAELIAQDYPCCLGGAQFATFFSLPIVAAMPIRMTVNSERADLAYSFSELFQRVGATHDSSPLARCMDWLGRARSVHDDAVLRFLYFFVPIEIALSQGVKVPTDDGALLAEIEELVQNSGHSHVAEQLRVLSRCRSMVRQSPLARRFDAAWDILVARGYVDPESAHEDRRLFRKCADLRNRLLHSGDRRLAPHVTPDLLRRFESLVEVCLLALLNIAPHQVRARQKG